MEHNAKIAGELPPDPKTGWHRVNVWRYTEGSGYSGDDRIGTSYCTRYFKGNHRYDIEYYITKTEDQEDTHPYSLRTAQEYYLVDANDEDKPISQASEPIGDFTYETLAAAENAVLTFALLDDARYLPKEGADKVLPIKGITRSRIKRDALAKCRGSSSSEQCAHANWINGQCDECGIFTCSAEIQPGVRPEEYCERFAVRIVHGDPLCEEHARGQD